MVELGRRFNQIDKPMGNEVNAWTTLGFVKGLYVRTR